MENEDFMGSSDEGPAGENFGEEERRRKLIYGTLALVGAVVATLILLYAFGMTSAKNDPAGGNEAAGAVEAKEK